MRNVRTVNMILSITLVVAFLSGVLLQIFNEVMVFQIMHKLSAVILVLGVIAHVVQHKKRKGNKEDE